MSDWVDCPICRAPDMQKTVDRDGNALIKCVNHSCLSNGGTFMHPDAFLEQAKERAYQRRLDAPS